MTALLAGLGLGLSAGISPGPLLTLVITRSLSGGFWAGLRTAVAPLISDAPIVLITLLVFTSLPPALEALLTIGGGFFLIYLGIETWRSATHAHLEADVAAASASTDVWRGALVNALSPHPWLFWISVGSPTLTRFYQAGGVTAAAGFLVGFYSLLIGGKIAIALAVAGGRRYLNDHSYAWLLRASGAVLCLFGVLLIGSFVQQHSVQFWP